MLRGKFKECKSLSAFALLHGLPRKRVESIGKQLFLKRVIPPEPDGRGKHNTRLNNITDESVQKIHCHAVSFSKRVSHYSRRPDANKQYLPAVLTIKEFIHGEEILISCRI